MIITVRNNYLVFPVYTHATEKKLIFRYEDETVYQLNIKLDHASPDFYAYIDVSRFKGKDIELSVIPEMEFSCRETDEVDLDNLYREAIRPQIHFTAKNGFLGSPKALFYSEGVYHVFYRFNPADTECGNIHIGHATSKDLVHWQEEKNAFFPNVNGESDYEMMAEHKDCESTELFSLLDSEGNQKWISLKNTGKYHVGCIENGQFKAEQPEQTLCYGNTDCAGGIFTGTGNGRTIRMDWNGCEMPHSSFCGQMGFPTELFLEKHNGVFYLQALPVAEIGVLYKNTNRYANIKMKIGKEIKIPLADAAQLIHIKGNFVENAVLEMIFFGRKITLDFSENQLCIGKSKAPVSLTKENMDITLLIDRCGAEIFADRGKICVSSLATAAMMDRNLLSLVLTCNTEYTIDFAEIHALEPIWQTSPKKF